MLCRMALVFIGFFMFLASNVAAEEAAWISALNGLKLRSWDFFDCYSLNLKFAPVCAKYKIARLNKKRSRSSAVFFEKCID